MVEVVVKIEDTQRRDHRNSITQRLWLCGLQAGLRNAALPTAPAATSLTDPNDEVSAAQYC